MKRTLWLTPRLQAVAEGVPPGARLCDVGTDHAYLPAALALDGKIISAIASDIRKGPLDRAADTVAKYGLSGTITLRLCPGLEGVSPQEVDAISICGMGGEMICSILAGAPWTREGKKLLLQPMRSQEELRLWLIRHGYRITKERVLREEAHWYTVLEGSGGRGEDLSPVKALAGDPKQWDRSDDWTGYVSFLLGKVHKMRSGLERSRSPDQPRLEQLRSIEAELTWWHMLLEKGVWPT